jgi:segregation and condensation protein A
MGHANSTHIVKTPVYEGPLDLLLELIEKRKLLINDISLAEVTDEYIARVNTLENLPVEETANFISLAATLLLIKSRSLLPTLAISEEENRDIRELEYRLAMYQIIKQAAQGLEKRWGRSILFEGAYPEPEPLFIPDDSITIVSLRQAALNLIDGFPKAFALPKVGVKKIISIEEMITALAERVSSAMSVSFREFSGLGTRKVKSEVIISFLALLELVKQGIINATQEAEFGDIRLEPDAVATPSYE